MTSVASRCYETRDSQVSVVTSVASRCYGRRDSQHVRAPVFQRHRLVLHRFRRVVAGI